MKIFRHLFMTLAIGAMGTALHFSILIVLVNQAGRGVVLSSSFGALAGAIFNYLMNFRFNYGGRASHSRSAPAFLLVAVFGFLLNAILMRVIAVDLNFDYRLAQLFTTGGVFIFTFTVNHSITFAEAIRPEPGDS